MKFTMESRGKAFEITCDDSVFTMAVGHQGDVVKTKDFIELLRYVFAEWRHDANKEESNLVETREKLKEQVAQLDHDVRELIDFRMESSYMLQMLGTLTQKPM